jgi:small subunit ribosomal protein S1
MEMNMTGPGETEVEVLTSEQPAAESAPSQSASAPGMEQNGVVETPAVVVPEADSPAPAEPHPDEAAPLDETHAEEANAPAEANGLKRGDIISGTVTETSPTSVKVTLENGAVGLIPSREMERLGRDLLEMLNQPNAAVSVYVVNPRDQNGNVILSLNRALEEIDWRKAVEHQASQAVYETVIAGYNKGGLIVRFGRVRGFVPQSQLGPDRKRGTDTQTPEERWGGMVGQPISVKVMEVDRPRNRLILSERMATRENRENRKEALINQLKVGEVRTGRIVSLVDFGAFVDVGGAEGLVHLTEISWQHVTHPKDALQIGQEVKVEVISIDQKNKRIGLSMKRQAADPWDTVATGFNIGQLVQGTVTKLTKFGAFVRLTDLPEIEGLVHISELSDQRVTHPREVLEEGEVVTLRVVKMDVKDRRLGLSMKRVNSAEYLDLDWGSA